MRFRSDRQTTVDSLLKDLNSVSVNVEEDINRQVNDYLSSLDDTYIPNTSGDTTRFADAVYICMEDKYIQKITEGIAVIASEFSDRYSKCLGKIMRLQLSSPDIELSEDILAQITICKEKANQVGMVNYILESISFNERENENAR